MLLNEGPRTELIRPNIVHQSYRHRNFVYEFASSGHPEGSLKSDRKLRFHRAEIDKDFLLRRIRATHPHACAMALPQKPLLHTLPGGGSGETRRTFLLLFNRRNIGCRAPQATMPRSTTLRYISLVSEKDCVKGNERVLLRQPHPFQEYWLVMRFCSLLLFFSFC